MYYSIKSFYKLCRLVASSDYAENGIISGYRSEYLAVLHIIKCNSDSHSHSFKSLYNNHISGIVHFNNSLFENSYKSV